MQQRTDTELHALRGAGSNMRTACDCRCAPERALQVRALNGGCQVPIGALLCRKRHSMSVGVAPAMVGNPERVRYCLLPPGDRR